MLGDYLLIIRTNNYISLIVGTLVNFLALRGLLYQRGKVLTY